MCDRCLLRVHVLRERAVVCRVAVCVYVLSESVNVRVIAVPPFYVILGCQEPLPTKNIPVVILPHPKLAPRSPLPKCL